MCVCVCVRAQRTQWEKQLEEEQQERLRLGSVRSAVLLERQQSRTNRMQRQELDHTNAQLAEAQRQQSVAHYSRTMS